MLGFFLCGIFPHDEYVCTPRGRPPRGQRAIVDCKWVHKGWFSNEANRVAEGYIPCNRANYGNQRPLSSIKYIVIHYTANNGDTAKNNCDYFKNNAGIGASAHYFVDENQVLQSVKDEFVAWHAGTRGTYYHPEARNANSIGVELCSRKDENGKYYFKPETVANAIKITKELMGKYNIDAGHIVRHYDVTHKNCPAPFVEDPSQWSEFKRMLGGSARMYKVQVGAFSSLSNALALKKELAAKGVDSVIVKGSTYKVQCGAFSVKANAKAYVEKLNKIGYDALIVCKPAKNQ